MTLVATDIGQTLVACSNIPQTWARILPHFEMDALAVKEDYGGAGRQGQRASEWLNVALKLAFWP